MALRRMVHWLAALVQLWHCIRTPGWKFDEIVAVGNCWLGWLDAWVPVSSGCSACTRGVRMAGMAGLVVFVGDRWAWLRTIAFSDT